MKWTEVVKKFPEANMLQSPEYGKMNELLGAKVVHEDFGGKGWALMIVRDARRGRYLELPCGPLIDWADRKLVEAAFEAIREVAEREKCNFVRVRPQLRRTPENMQILADLGLKKSPMHLAAEHTVMIDLSKSSEELLAAMRRQTRYEVRKAGKLGVTVEKSDSEAIFREFHEVQAETARRQNFVPPNLRTLLAEREAFGKDIKIYVARTGVEQGRKNATEAKQKASGVGQETTGVGEAIAYGLVIRAGEEGDYYEAASTALNRKLPGADALLWQAMQDLKEAGYKRFNLWGIAPEGQPHHRYAGVTTFKTGFGGEIVEYVPAHDLVIDPLRYRVNWVVETIRRKWRHLG